MPEARGSWNDCCFSPPRGQETGQDLLDRIPDVADMTAVDLYGDLGPQLEQWVAEHPFAHAHSPLRP